jgi:hypothetical protein
VNAAVPDAMLDVERSRRTSRRGRFSRFFRRDR